MKCPKEVFPSHTLWKTCEGKIAHFFRLAKKRFFQQKAISPQLQHRSEMANFRHELSKKPRETQAYGFYKQPDFLRSTRDAPHHALRHMNIPACKLLAKTTGRSLFSALMRMGCSQIRLLASTTDYWGIRLRQGGVCDLRINPCKEDCPHRFGFSIQTKHVPE